MSRNYTIEEELRSETPVVAGIVNKSVYSVPADYFENIAIVVLRKINNKLESELAFTNSIPYSIPEHYFQDLSTIILQKIREAKPVDSVVDELNSIAPLLNTINKKQVYAVPQGYFENVSSTENRVQKPQGKVIGFHFNKIYKFTAAAVVTGIVAIGMYLFTGKETATQQASLEASKTEVKNLSEADIVEFLADPGVATFSSSRPAREIHDAVKDIPDDEIKQFLQDSEAPEGI